MVLESSPSNICTLSIYGLRKQALIFLFCKILYLGPGDLFFQKHLTNGVVRTMSPIELSRIMRNLDKVLEKRSHRFADY